jgi:hypothetical protein
MGIRRVVGTLVALVVFLAFVAAVTWVYVDLESEGGMDGREMLLARLAADSGQGAPLGVLVTARWNRLPLGTPLEVQAVVLNLGSRDLPGVAVAAGVAEPVRLAPCAGRATGPAPLPAGEAERFCGRLTLPDEPAVVRLPVRVSWDGGAGAASGRLLELGPVRVYDPGKERWRRFVDRATSLLIDLALPFALGLLGWLFKLHQDDRQRMEETWNLMLPIVHATSERYYTPVLSALAGVDRRCRQRVRDGGDMQPPGDDDVNEGFFYFVGLLSHLWALVQERGGFYFKDRAGEEMAQASWSAVLRRAKELPDSRVYWEALEATDRFATLVEFERAYVLAKTVGLDREAAPTTPSQRKALRDMRTAFGNWVKAPGFDLELAVMKVLYEVVQFEMNAIYYRWYQRTEAFPFAELKEEYLKLRKADEKRLNRVAEELESYLWHRAPVRTWLIPGFGPRGQARGQDGP